MTIAVAVVIVLVAVGIYLYNRLVRDRNRVDAAWSDIDVQLQRRHDLVPQLVRAVDQYAGYERATIEAVTALRNEAINAATLDVLGKAEEKLAAAMLRLVALAEDYPDLKANRNFLDLQKELVETEDYLQFARRYYNGAVRALNTRIESVPSNIVAAMFGFGQRDYFQKNSDEAANVPLVDLGRVEKP